MDYRLFLALPLLCATVTLLPAQTNLLPPVKENKPIISFDFQHPFFKSGSTDFTVLSGTYDLMVAVPVSPTLSIIGTLPYAAYSSTSRSGRENSVGALANISLGVRNTFVPGSSALDFKLFLPTAPGGSNDNRVAMLYAMFHHLYEFEQYIPDFLGVQAQYRVVKNFDGPFIGGTVGSTMLIPTGDNDDVEVLLRYGLSGGYENDNVRVSLEFIGIGNLTNDKGFFEEGSTQHFIAFGAQLTGTNMFKPKVALHLPLGEDFSDVYGVALKLGCDVVLP